MPSFHSRGGKFIAATDATAASSDAGDECSLLVNLTMNLNETDESMNESLPLQGTRSNLFPFRTQEKDLPFHSILSFILLIIKLFMLPLFPLANQRTRDPD